jgi:hypothetical protein
MQLSIYSGFEAGGRMLAMPFFTSGCVSGSSEARHDQSASSPPTLSSARDRRRSVDELLLIRWSGGRGRKTSSIFGSAALALARARGARCHQAVRRIVQVPGEQGCGALWFIAASASASGPTGGGRTSDRKIVLAIERCEHVLGAVAARCERLARVTEQERRCALIAGDVDQRLGHDRLLERAEIAQQEALRDSHVRLVHLDRSGDLLGKRAAALAGTDHELARFDDASLDRLQLDLAGVAASYPISQTLPEITAKTLRLPRTTDESCRTFAPS